MAKPDCDDGFVMIALELFAVIARYKLTDTERLVLSEIMMACYGPPKDRSCHVDLPTLEDYTGVHRNTLRRAVAGLLKKAIVRRAADGGLSLVKDYDKWTPRPEGDPLSYGLSAVARFGPRKARAASTKGPGRAASHISDDHKPGGLTQKPLGQARRLESNGSGSSRVASGDRLCEGLGIDVARARAPEEDLRPEIRDTPLSPPTGGAEESDLSRPRPTRTRRTPKRSLDDQVAGFAARLAAELAAGKEAAGG